MANIEITVNTPLIPPRGSWVSLEDMVRFRDFAQQALLEGQDMINETATLVPQPETLRKICSMLKDIIPEHPAISELEVLAARIQDFQERQLKKQQEAIEQQKRSNRRIIMS